MAAPKPAVLLIDDETGVLEALEEALGDAYFFQRCTTADQALEALDLRPFSVAICDVNLPGQSGESVLAAVKSRWPGTEVIMVTGGRDLQTAVRCMRLGAYDYIPKPWHLEELRTVVARAAEKAGLVRENAMLRQGLPAPGSVELLGSSAAMHSLRQLIAKVAAHDNVVLITGESGTGKEMVARAIHAASVRRRERFVAIGCGSVPSDLVESELFGHERGAFSSAYSTRIGKFEYASGGTLFLDDVAALPMSAQAKLLRVLQEREVTRLGSNRVIPVDVRVLSSSNVDLAALVRAGQFRDDLYWRLSGVPVALPPLRDRGDDAMELFHHFLAQVAARYNQPVPEVTEGVLRALKRHSFPGNVRELAHLVETLFVLREGDVIGSSTLPVQMVLKAETRGDESLNLREAVQEFEKQAIQRALGKTSGNQKRAAELLGIHRNTLLGKISEYGLRRGRGEEVELDADAE